MKIKVCGMRDTANIAEVAALGVDYMGFIFYPPSPRNCLSSISRELVESLPKGTEPVAVTVNLDERELLRIAEEYGFKALQLHGNESPSLCRSLRSHGLTVIKAFGIAEAQDFERLNEYTGCVDLFLLDTATSSHGGSGRKFDWSLLDNYRLPEPFLLSGGIGPEDWEDIAELNHPRFAGIDLNSRFEVVPGLKDTVALEKFINRTRL